MFKKFSDGKSWIKSIFVCYDLLVAFVNQYYISCFVIKIYFLCVFLSMVLYFTENWLLFFTKKSYFSHMLYKGLLYSLLCVFLWYFYTVLKFYHYQYEVHRDIICLLAFLMQMIINSLQLQEICPSFFFKFGRSILVNRYIIGDYIITFLYPEANAQGYNYTGM